MQAIITCSEFQGNSGKVANHNAGAKRRDLHRFLPAICTFNLKCLILHIRLIEQAMPAWFIHVFLFRLFLLPNQLKCLCGF